MNEHLRLIERVARRNPVPDLDDPPAGAWSLDIVRSAVIERDTNMLTDQQPTSEKPETTQRRGWRVAVVAFVIVLLAGGGLWLVAQPSDTDVASGIPTTNAPSTEAERIALDTMLAYYTFDEEAFLAASRAREGAPEFFLWWLRLDRALNTTAESVSCTMVGSTTSTVRCSVVANSDLVDVFGLGTTRSNWKVTVGGGGWSLLEMETSIFDAWTQAVDLFDPNGPCALPPDATPDACALAVVEDAERWAAENGQ